MASTFKKTTQQTTSAANRSLSPIYNSFNPISSKIEVDCTSIASVGESSSHWSERDDQDNIALVNGAEAKDYSAYFPLSNNTSNSSEDDDLTDVADGKKIKNKLKTSKANSKKQKNQHHQQSSLGDDDDDDDNNDYETSSDHDTSKKKHDESTSSFNDDEDDDEDEDDDDDESNGDNDDQQIDDDDIYNIKPELRKYYEEQFKTMQPDLSLFITGSVAKSFFEKSGLKAHELSKIWELSDVNHDGVLSLSEFCTAMHLVVLRVRNYDLPNELPAKLQPYDLLTNFDEQQQQLIKQQQKSSIDLNSPIAFSGSPQINSEQKLIQPKAIRAQNQQQQQQQQQQHQPKQKHDLPTSPTTINNNNNKQQIETTQLPPPAICNQAQMEDLVEQINASNIDEIKILK
jgi:hypothetical protein